MPQVYDLAIIGSGAAGIACAKSALSHNLKTVIFEADRNAFGGTCVNHGCIPAKFLINFAKTKPSYREAVKAKAVLIEKIKKPLVSFLEAKGVKVVWDQAEFIDANHLKTPTDIFEAKNIIIACGSLPIQFLTGINAMPAEELMSIENIPKRFLIVGGGFIGVEFASLLNAYGCDVTLIEKEPEILPRFDPVITSRLCALLQRKGIEVITGKDYRDIPTENFDMLLWAVGRKSSVANLALEKAGVKTDVKGWVLTDHSLRTNVSNIYACGDVNGKRMLAYVAEYQARVCIDNICGKKTEEDYFALPECAFSLPQIARVGMLEAEAKAAGIKYRAIKSNFLRFSSAHVYNDQDGYIQVLIDEDDAIIGVSVISSFAAELINTFSLIMRQGLRIQDIKACNFIHPSISEIIPLLFQE